MPFHQLTEDAFSTEADILILIETWYKPHHSVDLFSIPGFVGICKARLKRKEKSFVFLLRCYTVYPNLQYLFHIIILRTYGFLSAVGLCVNICMRYNPPNPKYDSCDFADLVENFELSINSDNIFILTGGLNQMDTSRFESILGFVQMNQTLTHNNNIIYKFVTNHPDLFTVQIMQSLVKTKNKAVSANCDKPTDNAKPVNLHHTVEVILYSPNAANLLCQGLCNCNYNWNFIIIAIDPKPDTIDAIYNDFIRIINWHINKIVPLHKDDRLKMSLHNTIYWNVTMQMKSTVQGS